MAPRRNQFIQRAIKRPGVFHSYCTRKGHREANKTCIREALHARNSIIRRRAQFAQTLARLRGRRHRGRR